jgi:hypothetical protein
MKFKFQMASDKKQSAVELITAVAKFSNNISHDINKKSKEDAIKLDIDEYLKQNEKITEHIVKHSSDSKNGDLILVFGVLGTFMNVLVHNKILNKLPILDEKKTE